MCDFVAYLRGKDTTSALTCLLFLLYLVLYLGLPHMLKDHLTVNNAWLFYFLGFGLVTIFGGCTVTASIDRWLIPDLIFIALPRMYDAGNIYQTGNTGVLWLIYMFFLHTVFQAIVLLVTRWLLFSVRVLNDCGLTNPDDE